MRQFDNIFHATRRKMRGGAFARWGAKSDAYLLTPKPQRPLFADQPAPRKMNGWLWKHNDYITLKVSLSRKRGRSTAPFSGGYCCPPTLIHINYVLIILKLSFDSSLARQSEHLILCACQCVINRINVETEQSRAYRTIPSSCVFRSGIVR